MSLRLLPTLPGALPMALPMTVVAVVLALSLSSCGGDDPAPSADGAAATGAVAPAAAGSDADEAFTSAELDTVASSIDAVMADVSGYSIDGNALTFQVDGPRSDVAAKCTIATTVVGSFAVPEGTTIAFAYDDGSETC